MPIPDSPLPHSMVLPQFSHSDGHAGYAGIGSHLNASHRLKPKGFTTPLLCYKSLFVHNGQFPAYRYPVASVYFYATPRRHRLWITPQAFLRLSCVLLQRLATKDYGAC